MKYSFFDIHPECPHPEILKYMLEHNLDSFVDPEQDRYAQLGTKRIKAAFGIPSADIHYLPNGTITNVVGLASMLKPFEGVICPDSGHINNYEAGAFEATGHKIIAVEAPDGKLTPKLIESVLNQHESYYMVVPRVVYLTQVTELGTAYTQPELTEIIAYAKSKGLYTYLDGARLAMAIASQSAGITLTEFGDLDLDMFYIGGTKNGGLYGEALVIKNDEFKQHFPNYLKQRGGHMGKQRPMSLQFTRFFDDDSLWLSLATHANAMAERLRRGLAKAGAKLVHDSDANHVFMIMKNQDVERLEQDYGFERWEELSNGTSKLRLVCGWSTRDEDIDGFVRDVTTLLES